MNYFPGVHIILSNPCICVCSPQTEIEEWVGVDDTRREDKHLNGTFTDEQGF